jgi:outer membrane protein W
MSMKNSSIGIKSIFLVVLVLTFLIPINIFAQGPLYIAIKPGIYSPKAGDLDGFDTGFSGEVGFGYRVNPNLAGEIGLGYFHTQGEKTIEGARPATREFDINVFPITLTLKAIIPYKKWEFYGLGGGGVYIVSIPHEDYNHDYHDHHYDHDKDYHYDARLGGFLGAGINYNITRKIFVGVEGKYLWTDKVKVKYEEFDAGHEVEFRMDGIIATGVIGFRF